jgi:nitroreductase
MTEVVGSTKNILKSDEKSLQLLLDRRHSCRAFFPRPVDRQRIEEMLALAQRSPSWSNTQPWQVIVTDAGATQILSRELYAHALTSEPMLDYPAPSIFSGPAQDRRKRCGAQLYDAVGIDWADRQSRQQQAHENYRFFGAPHVAIVICDEDMGVYGAIDCGAYIAHFMLSATALGIGTVAQASVASQASFLRSHFGLTERQKIVCCIAFGYADETHLINQFRTERASIAESVIWHGFYE